MTTYNAVGYNIRMPYNSMSPPANRQLKGQSYKWNVHCNEFIPRTRPTAVVVPVNHKAYHQDCTAPPPALQVSTSGLDLTMNTDMLCSIMAEIFSSSIKISGMYNMKSRANNIVFAWLDQEKYYINFLSESACLHPFFSGNDHIS